MYRLKIWAALFGSAWAALLLTFAFVGVLYFEEYAGLKLDVRSVSAVLLAAALSAVPATFVASLLEPIVCNFPFRAAWQRALAYSLGGAFVGLITPTLLDLLQGRGLPDSHTWGAATFWTIPGSIGGAFFCLMQRRITKYA